MRSALRIVCIYAIVSTAWIILSDRVVGVVAANLQDLVWYSSIKGLLFVTVTGLLLYFLIQRRILEKQAIIERLDHTLVLKDELIRELHHRIKNNLQNLIGIIEWETRLTGYTEAAKERILGKLFSLSSLYDIVYEFGDFEHISLASVVKNLLKETKFDVGQTVVDIDETVQFSIEELVSLVLAVNELLEVVGRKGKILSVGIACRERRAIDITIRQTEPSPVLEDLEDVYLFLQGMDGTLSTIPAEGATSFRISIGAAVREGTIESAGVSSSTPP